MWLRYTSDKRAGEPPRGSLWCTFFTLGTAPRWRAAPPTRRLLPAPGPGEWARIDGGSIGPDGARGELEDCAWSVSWQAHAAPLPYLPARLLYDRRLPRSNGAAIVPDATFGGRLEVAGDAVDLVRVAGHGRPQLGR